MLKDITTLLFDLGGVLVDLNKNTCIQAFQRLGFQTIDQYLDIYVPKEGIFKQLEQGQINVDEFHEGIRDLIGSPVSDEAIDDAYRQMMTGISGYKLEMLRELKNHYQILLLSNTNPILMNYVKTIYFTNDGLQWSDYFDDLFLSYEMKMTKPDPNVYKELIRRSGIHPGTTFYLDDSSRNTEVAERFGFNTHLVTPHEDLRLLFKEKTISSL